MKWFIHFECEPVPRTIPSPLGKTAECPGHYKRGGGTIRHIAFPYMEEDNG